MAVLRSSISIAASVFPLTAVYKIKTHSVPLTYFLPLSHFAQCRICLYVMDINYGEVGYKTVGPGGGGSSEVLPLRKGGRAVQVFVMMNRGGGG